MSKIKYAMKYWFSKFARIFPSIFHKKNKLFLEINYLCITLLFLSVSVLFISQFDYFHQQKVTFRF